jgi:hypothetical protein
MHYVRVRNASPEYGYGEASPSGSRRRQDPALAVRLIGHRVPKKIVGLIAHSPSAEITRPFPAPSVLIALYPRQRRGLRSRPFAAARTQQARALLRNVDSRSRQVAGALLFFAPPRLGTGLTSRHNKSVLFCKSLLRFIRSLFEEGKST